MIEERGAPAENAADEARLLLRNQRPAEAARLMRASLADRPGTAGEQMLLGVALAQTGERTEALAALERAVLLDPDDAAAHFNLGQLYRQKEYCTR
jgi:cytochrome c-type biogenesis protein CcmH/NrfG